MRKVIKIFLASSITEFEAERNDLEVFIRNMSDIYEDQYDIKIKPVRCEQIDPYITDSRTQDIINESLRECEMCVILVYTRFGEFSYEEFRYALQSFRESAQHLPKIYVYFKCLEEGVTVDESVKRFMDELNNSLKHYYGTFKSLDTVKLRIALNFVAQKLDIANVAMDEGKIVLNGVRMDGLDVKNVSEFSNSEELQDLYARLRKLEPAYYELHAKYKKREFSTDSPLFEEYSKLATERSALKTQIEDLENAIFDFSIRLSRDEVSGNISERQKVAYQLFEAGDLDGANEVLDEEEIENDYRARKAKILARKMEELRKNAIVYIHEIKTKIDILKILPSHADGQKTIERLYEKILPEAEEMGVCLEVFYEYATHLFENLGWECREERLRKALDLALQLADLYEENEKESSFEKAGSLAVLTGKVYLALAQNDAESSYVKQAMNCFKSAEETFSVLAMRQPDKYNAVLTDVFQYIGKIHELKKDFVEAEKYYVKPVRFYLQSGKLQNPKYKKVLADNYVKLDTQVCFEKAIALYQELCELDEVIYLDGLRNCYKKYAELCEKKLGAVRGLHLDDERKVMEYANKAIEIAKKQIPSDPKKYNEILSKYYAWCNGHYCSSLQESDGKAYLLQAISCMEKCIDASSEQECVQNGYFESIVGYYEKLTSFLRYNVLDGTGISVTEDANERKAYEQVGFAWKKRELIAKAEMQKGNADLNEYQFAHQCREFAGKYLSGDELAQFVERTVFSVWKECAKKDKAHALRLLNEYFYTMNKFADLPFGVECFEACEKLARELGDNDAYMVLANAYLSRAGYYLDQDDVQTAQAYFEQGLQINDGIGERIANLAESFLYFYNVKFKGDTTEKQNALERWLLIQWKHTNVSNKKYYALKQLGDLYKAQGEYQKASEYYQDALACNDGASDTMYLYSALKTCYQQLGNVEEAEKYGELYLDKLLGDVKQDVERGFKPYLGAWEDACNKEAEGYIQQGDWTKAKAVLDRICVYLEEVIASGKKDFMGGQAEFEEALRDANFHRLDAYLVYGKYEDGIELARRLVMRTTEKLTALEQSKSYHANADKIMFTYGLYKWQYYLFKCYAALQDSRLEAQLLAFLDAAKKTEHREAYWAMYEVREYLEKNGYPSPLSEARMVAFQLKQADNAHPINDEYLARLLRLLAQNEFGFDVLSECAHAIQHFGGCCNDAEKEESVYLHAAALWQKMAKDGDRDALKALKKTYECISNLYISDGRDKWYPYKHVKFIEFLEQIPSTEETDTMLRSEYDEVFRLHYNWREYDKASAYCAKMEALLRKRPFGDYEQRRLAGIYNNWAVVYQAWGKQNEQREKLLLAEEILKMQFGKEGEVFAKDTLSTVYSNLAQLGKAEGDYAQAKAWHLQSFACQADAEKHGNLADRLEERRETYEKALPFFEEYAQDALEEVVAGYADVCKRAYEIRNSELKYAGFIPQDYLKCMERMQQALSKGKCFALAKTIAEEQLKVARDLLSKEGLNEIAYLKTALGFAVNAYMGTGDTQKAEEYQKELTEMSV